MTFASNRTATGRLLNRALIGSAACAVAIGLMSCSEGSTQRQAASAPAARPADYDGTTARVRRISVEQYQNTIHYVFGRDIEVGNPFAPLRRTDGLIAAGASSAGVTTGELQQLQRSASTIAAQVIDKGNIEQKTPSRRDFLVPCKPVDPTAKDDACAAKFIAQTGRLLFRRHLSQERVAELVASAGRGANDLKDFYAGLGTVIEGMLIDPKVLMIADVTEPDPKNPGKQRVDAYSLASRLSFFLWNAAPDDGLLKVAERGDLFDPKKRARVVDMMIASPRLEDGIRTFFDDMFGFEDFANLAKDPTAYPMMTGAVIKDAREQTLRTVVDHLLVKYRDYRDLYTTRETFMSPALATVYQVPTKPGWVPYQFAEDSPRVGLLTQISFLALGAHPARSSPTYRGKALREKMLCQRVPPPPANVDFSALENPAATHRTQRDRVNFHLQNPVCAGCHKITDPMGLVLENFDGAGRFRTSQNGVVIDTTGTLDGKNVDGPAQLGIAMRDHPALTTCLVRRMYSYGTGGPLSRGDNPAVEVLNKAFADSGYRVPGLLRMIANSQAFYEVVETPAEQKTADASAQSAAASELKGGFE